MGKSFIQAEPDLPMDILPARERSRRLAREHKKLIRRRGRYGFQADDDKPIHNIALNI
jgi:hypothetical protein